jgi:plastocyanin/streptogramin lyase
MNKRTLAVWIALSAYGLSRASGGPEEQADPGILFPGSTIELVKPDTKRGKVFTVLISNAPPYYSPGDLSVHVGDTVVWKNGDQSDTHSCVSADGTFSSSDVPRGGQWAATFEVEGEFPYACRFHPWMKGVIRVAVRTVEIEECDVPANLEVTDFKITRDGMWIMGISREKVAMFFCQHGTTEWRNANLPGDIARPSGVWVSGRSVWVATERGALLRRKSDEQTWATFSIPDDLTRLLSPVEDTFFWCTNASGERLYRWWPESGKREEVPVDVKYTHGDSFVSEPAGGVWILDATNGRIGLLSADSKQVETYLLPDKAAIAIATTDGESLWYGDNKRSKIGRVKSGWIVECASTAACETMSSLSAHDGKAWYVLDRRILGQVHNGVVSKFALPKGISADAVVADDSGAVWIRYGNRLGKVVGVE